MEFAALLSTLLKWFNRNRPPAPTPVQSQTIADCVFSGMNRWTAGTENYNVEIGFANVSDLGVIRVGYATCQWCPLNNERVSGKNAPHP